MESKGPLSNWKSVVSEATNNDFAWAPQIGLLLPSRNEGTSHVRSALIYASVYPSSASVLVTAGATFSF